MPGSSRTILLLGGTGFLGTNLAARLEATGHRAIVTGRQSSARDGRPAIVLPVRNVADIIALVRAEGVDTVVHMACTLLPSSDEAAYAREVEHVTLPMLRLARELAATDVGLAFLSSGGTIYGSAQQASFAEDDRSRPISLYGQAKLEAELHLMFLARTCGLRLSIFRPSNPFGRHQGLHNAQGLISVVFGRMLDGRPLDVWGDGLSVRDYVYIDDAVSAMSGLIERQAEGVYNIGSGAGYSLLDVVRTIETVTGRSIDLRFHPARAADVRHIVLDVSRLKAAGLYRDRPLAEGVMLYADDLGIVL